MDYLNPRLEPLYREIATAIRSVDTNHALLLAGAQWSIQLRRFQPAVRHQHDLHVSQILGQPDRATRCRAIWIHNRWKVPLLIGETGEYNDAWNQTFRELNERFGIGWCFWPYKESRHHDCRCFHPEAGGMGLDCRSRQRDVSTLKATPLPPRAQAKAILDAYLDAAKFKNDRINAGYLKSLGLKAP